MTKLIIIFVIFFSLNVEAANPPVIWFGNQAKFLNSGSIIVPGIGGAGVCKADSGGLFSTGSVSLSSEITGTLPIANGGTGQTTANSALNALLPTQTGNAGKFLETDGSNTTWSTIPIPTGTADTFAYFNGSGNLASLPNWTVQPWYGPSSYLTYSVPADPGDGSVKIYSYETEINGANDSTLTYPVAFNFDNHFDRSASGGDINSITGFNVNSTIEGSGLVGYSAGFQLSHSLGVGNPGTTTDSNSFVISSAIGTGYSVNNHNALNINYSNAGTVSSSEYLINANASGAGSLSDFTGINVNAQVSTSNNMTLLNMSANQFVTGNFLGLNLQNQSDVTGSNTLINVNNNGDSANGIFPLSTYNNGAVTGSYVGGAFYNDGTISQNFTGIQVSGNGDVTKSYAGMGINVNHDIGDGSGQTANGVIFNIASGHTTDGNIYGYTLSNNSPVTGQITGMNFNNAASHTGISGYNFFNNGTMSGSNTVYGAAINNQGTGYRFQGISVYNNADQSEETRGFQFNDDNTDARTKTALDIDLSGNATDDVQAIRVNMSSQTSTNEHPQSLQLNGGSISVQSSYTPFNSEVVSIGNNFSVTNQLNADLTGTDLLATLIQSNLIVGYDITTGPVGLDTNMVAMASQIAVGSGKTVPLMRSLLLGTSVPQGSGGTITEHVVLELLGLPSFGGSVSNPTRIGIQDSQILGQNFCDTATDCWFLRVRDENAENFVQKLAIGTASQKVSTDSKLEILDGHIKITQTTGPAATPNANAGTGATCTSTGTDHTIAIELTTGTTAWAAGSQCDIAFDQAFTTAPICVFSAANNNAAIAIVSTYLPSASTAGFSINFVNADVAQTTYNWSVHCF